MKLKTETYVEECVSIVDPSDEDVRTVNCSISWEAEADVAASPHLDLEHNVRLAHLP